ncbi:hypothetical protein B0A48_14058 [Cryoendolithus antarcticus]|uniref:FAM50A/XAP5 C-terminal domain-containing protein n=1 Tax=Cryoendolithus antarcticus TaxID=1507870 RepID=A0A1V8SMT7_9PEZI|nr:hypothetical protein B0A48_14058 [Cryoendolithus antarcticus]
MADSDPSPSIHNARFTAQAHAVEDTLKEQTVGLVHLSDFRKRRAEALEQSQDGSGTSGATTPEGREGTPKPTFKKRGKGVKKAVLSFGDDEEGYEGGHTKGETVMGNIQPGKADLDAPSATTSGSELVPTTLKKRLKANASAPFVAKAQTKASIAKETALKDTLRKEYIQLQEAVKATEFILPFVFYEGKDIPGGQLRLKKGDFIWLFLEKARKLGAELAETGQGPGGAGGRRREWARISVDDLMIVRGEMIVPHHLDFHHFIVNAALSYHGPLFPYSADVTTSTPARDLSRADSTSLPAGLTTADELHAVPATPDADLEGFSDDPALTKVIDRRWYEKNKHIYPMSVWEEYDASRDYSKGGRKDQEGNAFFFSSNR